VTAAFSDCLHVRCPNCGAEPNDFCTNTLGDGQKAKRHSPCKDRMRAAERT
jgi:hypothetical protein